VHGDSLDLSLVNYVNMHQKITIRCVEHDAVISVSPKTLFVVKNTAKIVQSLGAGSISLLGLMALLKKR